MVESRNSDPATSTAASSSASSRARIATSYISAWPRRSHFTRMVSRSSLSSRSSTAESAGTMVKAATSEPAMA